MKKILLIILALLPFEMVYAESEERPKVYVLNDLWNDWKKKKIPPMQAGDYFIAPPYYARYCKSEMMLHETFKFSAHKERSHFLYVCEYNGKPLKQFLHID